MSDTNVMFPCDFGDPRIGTDVALHVDVITFFNGVQLQFAAKFQANNWHVYKISN